MAYGVFGGTYYQYGSKISMTIKMYPPIATTGGGGGGSSRPTEGKMYPRGKP